MNKQKLAIIGANAAITMLINKAKEMGYETHVFSWQNGEPGESAADYFYPISIDQKEEILLLCRKIGICGICSITSDYAAPTVNYIAEELGLPCNPSITNIVARNKYRMRCALKSAGLYTPQFVLLNADYQEAEARKISYPVIVKPTDRWSSKGVTRVDNPTDLRAAVLYAIEESFDKNAIVEEFIEGPEYSAECICYNGQRNIVALTQKQTTGFPHYIETGHIQPALINTRVREKIYETAIKGLEALGIENGAAHVEFRIMPNGEIGIIEIGARMGGDCIGTDLTPISTGIDYIRMVVDVACGKQPDFTVRTKPQSVKINFIMSEMDYLSYLDIKRKDPKCIVKEGDIDLDFSHNVTDSSTRHGYYIISPAL